MRRALYKDILRTIGHEKKRFFSILVIVALGVTMLTGLRAACNDLRRSADVLFDEQKLFDIQVSSTLGLDDEDVEALRTLEAAEIVEGEYSENVFTEVEGVHEEVTVRTLGEQMNIPTVLEGALPTGDDEIAVTQSYIIDTGKKIGDTLTFARETSDEEEDPVFAEIEYTITGIVIDPFDVNDRENAVSFRAAASTAYTFFVLPSAADTDIYTSVYVYLNDTADLMCYGDEYKQIVRQVKTEINDTLKSENQQRRYEKIYDEAMDEYNDAYDEVMSELDDAQRDIEDAQKELDDAAEEIRDGQKEITDNRQTLEEGRQEIADGRAALDDGKEELESGRTELENEEADAERQIADGQAQIDAGYESLYASWDELEAAALQISEGETQLAEGEAELAATRESTLAQIDDGISQIEDGLSQLEDGISQLEDGRTQLEDGIEQLEDGRAQLQAGIDSLEAEIAALAAAGSAGDSPDGNAAELQALNIQLAALEATLADLDGQLAEAREQEASLDAQLDELETQRAELNSQLSELQEQRAQAVAQFDAAQQEIDANAAELAAGRQEYEDGLNQWYAGLAELDAAQAELDEEAASARVQIDEAWETIQSGEAELEDAEAELEDAEEQLADGQKELDDGQQELTDGKKEFRDGLRELNDGRQEFEENKEEALDELADALGEIEDLEVARWYIQTRDSLSGYSNIENDAASIQSLGNFIPLIFFVVAILIGLTAITRMEEEDRGLIGTYKALGFKNREIRRKYLVFATAASLLGGVVGDFAGFVILPKIIFSFFKVMYQIPAYLIRFEPASGTIGIAMFTVGILLAALYVIHGDLTYMPATLMRPPVPKGGTRIFLEHIPLVWKRLSFLNKVTARNLFRYKRRLLMTIIGILGCTGLLICGFGIKNTVADLESRQYGDVVRYDILAVATDNDKLLSHMDDPENIEAYLNLEVDSMTLQTSSEDTESVQVFVIPDDAPISEFIKIADVDGVETAFPTEGILVTRSIEKVIGVEAGDTVTLQDLSLNEAECPVALVTENYLGDIVYVSESYYEEAFGEAYEPNSVLIRLTEECLADDPIAYAKALGAKDGLLSTSSTQEFEETFSQSFAIMDIVVYVIVVLAAALAFVVLFTLATTNISEREREIATIKVLGFFDSEVHLYVNKETVILSSIGIALGLPLGWLLTRFICWALKIPGIYFAPSVHPVTYVICAAMTVAFTLIVDQITNRMLNKIDPATALKSIE